MFTAILNVTPKLRYTNSTLSSPPGMCAIPGKDRLDTGQGWRTSSGKTEPIWSGSVAHHVFLHAG